MRVTVFAMVLTAAGIFASASARAQTVTDASFDGV
jgi:hypothetical protein